MNAILAVFMFLLVLICAILDIIVPLAGAILIGILIWPF